MNEKTTKSTTKSALARDSFRCICLHVCISFDFPPHPEKHHITLQKIWNPLRYKVKKKDLFGLLPFNYRKGMCKRFG